MSGDGAQRRASHVPRPPHHDPQRHGGGPYPAPDAPREPPARFPLLDELGPLDTWVLNTYAGCELRCRYCITSAQGPSLPRVPRRDVPAVLGDELEALASSAGLPPRLAVGSYADVYPTVERHHGVTRAALEVLVARELPFTVVTKGDTVVRDVDLYRALRSSRVQISLCSVDDAQVARLDPGAPSATRRLEVVHELARAGVRVRVQASPWIPGVSDVAALLRLLDGIAPVTVTPLRIPPHVADFAARRGLTQASVNESFRREYERVGPRPRVVWSRPPALDGAPPHIADNIGRPVVDGWDPAQTARRPGLAPGEQLVRLVPAHRALRERSPQS